MGTECKENPFPQPHSMHSRKDRTCRSNLSLISIRVGRQIPRAMNMEVAVRFFDSVTFSDFLVNAASTSTSSWLNVFFLIEVTNMSMPVWLSLIHLDNSLIRKISILFTNSIISGLFGDLIDSLLLLETHV